ncbi:MAG: arylsulfatase [Opitutaceae bacterium]|nr:arylsulfatase [Opitutaceae bacterium]
MIRSARFLFSLGLALGFALFAAAATPPNVLLIVADDQGWGDVPWRGSPARMPNLDALRQSGTELLRFYASPVCSPTRASLLTGRSAVQLGIRDQFAPNDAGLSLLEHLMPETFRAAGYQTALIGKWHLGSTTAERRPLARGFDRFYGFLGPAVDYYTHLFTGPAGGLDWQRDGVTLNEPGYATDLIAAEAVRLLRTRDPAKPFFHVVTFNAPHTPYAAPEELKANYPTLSGDAQTYAAMLESLDLGLGRILAELTAQGLANDTLVVFVSDNGGTGPGRNTPLRLNKGNIYDGGIRVPALIRWPGVVRAGATSDQFVTAQDIFPTIAAAAGVTPRNRLPFDGLNLWPTLRTGAPVVERTFAMATTANYAQFEGRMKLVRIGAREELYDIVADPSETNNLAAAQPAVLARLQATLAGTLARSLGPETHGDARVTNLSVRAAVGGTAGTPILGFVVTGGEKRLVVRAAGPALAAFGVAGALADPLLELRQGQALVQSNDNWSAIDAEAMAAVGAFGLSAASMDAALVVTLPPAAYTAQTSSVIAGGTGVALVEIYDTGTGATAARLVNASARAFVGTGASILIPGIVVGGDGAAGLLIRATGPALGKFGVADALADPMIALYRGSTLVATNDDWGAAANAAQITTSAAAAGAFAFDNGSRDAALLTTLPAGTSYSVQVSGKNNTTGTVLVEFYLVQ